MKITIELTPTIGWGHPDNPRPSKQSLISKIVKQLPVFLDKDNKGHLDDLDSFEIASVRVD